MQFLAIAGQAKLPTCQVSCIRAAKVIIPAGDNSSVLFVFESCVLLHAAVCFSAGDDQRKERGDKERNDECEENSSV